MDLTTSQYAYLIIALTLGWAIFLWAYLFPSKFTIPAMFLMIPFQLISSKYGTINMALTYTVGIALLFKKELKTVPLLAPILLILYAYILTISQLQNAAYLRNFVPVISIASNFVIFIITYNYILNENNVDGFLKILVALNILVIFFAFCQFLIGFEDFSLFGIKQLTIDANKQFEWAQEVRLKGGPFNAVGINAEFAVIQILLLSYFILKKKGKWRKGLYFSMIALNFFILTGTGNRGGFLSLILGGLLFFFFFRKEIGIIKILGINMVMIPIFLLLAFVMVSYTEYNSIYDRFQKTDFEGVMPDTRIKVWTAVIEEIKKKPILGHGSYLIPRGENRKIDLNESGKNSENTMQSPHNLYLFLLYTTGVVGLVSFFVFFIMIFKRFSIIRKAKSNDSFLNGTPKLGILILIVFLFDQNKVEFLRFNLSDFQHYIFMLFGAFFAFTEILKNKLYSEEAENQ